MTSQVNNLLKTPCLFHLFNVLKEAKILPKNRVMIGDTFRLDTLLFATGILSTVLEKSNSEKISITKTLARFAV